MKKASGVTKIKDSYGRLSDWYALCARVRKRDNYRCIFCKVPEDHKKGVYHDVHHLRGLARSGTTSMVNLGLTCEKCHKKRPGHSHMR